jgi:hypothetical protein
MCCPEMSVKYYHSTLRNTPAERISYLAYAVYMCSLRNIRAIYMVIILFDQHHLSLTAANADASWPLSVYDKRVNRKCLKCISTKCFRTRAIRDDTLTRITFSGKDAKGKVKLQVTIGKEKGAEQLQTQ